MQAVPSEDAGGMTPPVWLLLSRYVRPLAEIDALRAARPTAGGPDLAESGR